MSVSADTKTAEILDADAILARAQKAKGLTDWGDPTFVDRFRNVIAHIKMVGMDEAGQRAAAENCHWMLTDRLGFYDDHKKYDLGKEQIVRPVFATGQPRSGTTLLHALLAVDPNGRALRFWEVMNPTPPSGLAGPDDPRRAKSDDDWREINTKLDFWLRSHPYNDMLGDGLPEDERAWGFDFRQLTPTGWWRVPMGVSTGVFPKNEKTQIGIHKMMLQHCQHGLPKKYWVLKGFHANRLRELFDAYPDACMVWSHRDPVQVAASRTALIAELIEGIAGHCDWIAMAKEQLAMLRADIKVMMEDPIVMDPRIHHIRYSDFTKDPIGVIRTYYQKYGVPFTDETEKAMRDYLANNKGDRYGKFKYSTDMIGEDIEALHEEFAPYRERFGIEIEKRH
jgi:hypothetical protein